MKKIYKTLGVLVLLLAATGVFAAQVEVQRSNFVINEEYDTSYKVLPTEDVLALLAEYGINANGSNDRSVTLAIDSLKRVDFDTDDGFSFNDTWENQMDRLNFYVTAALTAARNEGYDVVYMEIGDTRWAMYPGTEEE